MNSAVAKGVAWLGSIGLPTRCALFTGALVAFFAIVGAYQFFTRGAAAVAAAAVAALLCWIGGLIALLLSKFFHGPQRALHSTLAGMLFRMGVPLAGGLWLHRQGGALADAGVFGLVVVFYLWALVVETSLSLPTVGIDKRLSKVV